MDNSNNIFVAQLKDLLQKLPQLKKQELEHGLFELTVSCMIADEINQLDSVEAATKLLVDRIADVLSVEMVSVMMLDEKSHELIIKAAKGLDEHLVHNTKIKVGEGVAGSVAKDGKAILLEDITKDPRFKKRSSRYYTNSLLSVPLIIRDNVLGVVNINNKVSKEVFNKQDLSLLSEIINKVSVSIQNVRLRQELSSVKEGQSKILSTVSHEFKIPLTNIKESISMMLEGLMGDLSDQQKNFLDLAHRNVTRLQHLVEELLDLSKAEVGRLHLKRNIFDMYSLVKDAAFSFNLQANQKGIKLTLEPAQKIDVWADRDKITQVLINLLDNAIKFTPQGGEVTIAVLDKGRGVSVEVWNSGPGIPKDDCEKIFDKYQRLEHAIKSGIKGTGLGLAICKEIVDMHQGSISVESSDLGGSKFIVSVPKDLRKQGRIQ